jgi:hypothetical protein
MSGGGEVEQLRLQVGQLQQQLAQEQHLRLQAEEAGEAAAADRARLQRARDELATALLLAEKRAQDAEEEQLRAEEQAAALAQQLQEVAAAAEAAGGGAAQPAAAPATTTAAAAAADKDSKGLQGDLEVMLAALDQERHRSEELVRTLEAAEREAVSATEELLKAKLKLKQRDSKSGDSKAPTSSGGGGGGVQASASGASLAVVEGLPPGAHGDAAVALLQQRIAALKASRDKLIAAFDAQAAEVERLSTDNAALAEVSGSSCCCCWSSLCWSCCCCLPGASHSRPALSACTCLLCCCSLWCSCGRSLPTGRLRRRTAWHRMSGSRICWRKARPGASQLSGSTAAAAAQQQQMAARAGWQAQQQGRRRG